MADSENSRLFTEKKHEGVSVSAWIVAGSVVVLIVACLFFIGRRDGAKNAVNTELPLDGYASSLPISGLAMVESTSLSGGKSTFVDGHVANTGNRIVTGATVQVIFRNDEGLQPQVFTTPLTIISMREPYIDTKTLAGTPLKPGDSQDFRLTFEQVAGNWNGQMPEVRIVRVDSK